MGKIRIKTLGDEEQEKKQALDAKKRAEAKKAEKAETPVEHADEAKLEKREDAAVAFAPTENQEKKDKKEKFQKKTSKGSTRSKSYQTKAVLVEKDRPYTLDAAVKLLPELKRAKFDETVELHFTTTEKGISGSVTLPHGTGKQTRIAIARGSDSESIDKLVKSIESGNLDFDILIATPDAMPKLARVAKVLGPRGMMPNPKNGTVSPNPDEVAKKYEGGQINFKTESKFPLLHVAVGKVSFGEDKIKENVVTVMQALDKKKLRNATLKSTMSPAIHLDLASL
jgi:large subunit ribosomal protein L1